MSKVNSTHTASNLKEILLRVLSIFEKRKRLNVLIGASVVVAVWITSLILLENVIYFSPEVKIGFLGVLLLIAVLTIWFGFKNIKSQTFIEFYRIFARSSGIPELSYALDLETSTNANPKLVEAAILKNLGLVDETILKKKLKEFLDNAQITKQFSIKRNMSLISVTLLFVTAFSLNSPTERLVNFWIEYEKPNPFFYTINPGDVTIEQGSSFFASITFDGEKPEEVNLRIKTSVEENYRSRSMDLALDTFSSLPFDLNNDVSYYIEMDGYKSPLYSAQVQLLPRFSELSVTVVPPAYTQLDSTTLRYPFSRIQAYQGSKLIISGVSNKSLEEFTTRSLNDSTSILLNEFLGFEFKIGVENIDTLSFSLVDESGLKNQNPFQFVIEPIQDEYPYVELIEPNSSFETIDPTTIELLFRSTDDFNLTSSSLNYELKRAFVENPITNKKLLEKPNNGVLQSLIWDLSELNLKPKDELTFWVEVTDNDSYNGFKSSRSEVLTLSIPSLIDYFEDVSDKEDEVETDLEDISEAFNEMSDQYDNFKEQLKENPETNFEQKRQLEEVQRQQEEIKKRIDELNEKFDEIKEELSENNMLSEETLEAYQELQELMKEIDDPAFREALEKLQEQMSEMTPEQLRDALQDAEFNEELYKQRLERTLELFKQLKLNSELEKLAQTYEDLARQEEELENQSEDASKQEEQRKSTLEQTEKLKEKIDELSKNATEKTEKSLEEYQNQSQEELEKIQEKLEEMLKELQEASENSDSKQGDEGEKGDSGEQQQDNLKQDFQKLAEMTRQQMQQMQQQQMNVNVAGLQYILYSLLNLSIEQEGLVTYANATENRSQAYIEYARDQKNVEDIFISLSDSLFELSKKIPQFSNQINEKKQEVEIRLTNSLEQMAERNQSRASIATRQALGGINEITFLIANLLEQIQNSENNSGQGSGSMSMQQMMEQLQQMGENQQQLNQQMQEMINDMQGERLTQDQMERLNQLSKQQNRIRQQLQELQRNGELEGGDQLGSVIERMIEEMEDTINDLRGGAIDPTLIERQQNILSRMLEAEQALQERDEEEKREGTTGVNPTRTTPPELTLEELEKQIRNRLNDPNFTKYSTDYQRLIEKYFELLKQIQERELQ